MKTLSHIINPVDLTENTELFHVQKTTFASLIKAKKYSETCQIELCVVKKSTSSEHIPSEFKILPPLSRDIRDLVSGTQKTYPFLSDIIQQHAKSTEAEYVVYSNLDIAIMPFFYDTIQAYLNSGYDAIIVNRRRVHNKYSAESNLNILFAEAGKTHTGYDCFVVKKSLIDRFIWKDICLGVPGVGNDLFYNIFTYAEKPVLLTDKHLTFHVGMELYKDWGDRLTVKHNSTEFKQLLQELYPDMKADNFPGADLCFIKRHFKWLMNPTFDYLTMLKLDAKRGFKKTIKPRDRSFIATRKQKYLEELIRWVNFD